MILSCFESKYKHCLIFSANNVFARDADTRVTWVYDSGSNQVTFTLTGKAAAGQWLALGISNDKAMANTDIVHVGVTPSGQIIFSDR